MEHPYTDPGVLPASCSDKRSALLLGMLDIARPVRGVESQAASMLKRLRGARQPQKALGTLDLGISAR